MTLWRLLSGRRGSSWPDSHTVEPQEHVREAIAIVPLELWRSDAIVLFDWLASVDLDDVPIRHKAEKQALADLFSRLEQTDVAGTTQNEIDFARAEVARDMGW